MPACHPSLLYEHVLVVILSIKKKICCVFRSIPIRKLLLTEREGQEGVALMFVTYHA